MVSKRDLGADCLRTGERELASQEAEGVWLAAPTNPAPWRGGGQSCFPVREAFQGRVNQESEGEGVPDKSSGKM